MSAGENKRVCNLSKLPFCFWCIDDQTVQIDPRCCDESTTIYRLLRNEYDDEIMMDFTSATFKLVDYYCSTRSNIMDEYVHDDRLAADKLDAFDYEFIEDINFPEILDIWEAASMLGINSLMNLTRLAIAEMIEGKSGDEILNIFRMPDFTLEAMEEMRELHAWAFETMIEAC